MLTKPEQRCRDCGSERVVATSFERLFPYRTATPVHRCSRCWMDYYVGKLGYVPQPRPDATTEASDAGAAAAAGGQ